MAEPKFKVGDTVHCKRDTNGQTPDFDFIGEVLSSKQVEENLFEYEVSNAPELFPGLGINCLIWEHEMEPYNA